MAGSDDWQAEVEVMRKEASGSCQKVSKMVLDACEQQRHGQGQGPGRTKQLIFNK